MMETATKKMQKICDSLRRETIEPAQQEAREIVENAHLQAADIIDQAKKEAAKVIDKAKKKMDEEAKVFSSSLSIAGQQTIDALKQKIEAHLFSETLHELLMPSMDEKEVLAKIITALIEAIEKEGLEGDLSVFLSKTVSPLEVTKLLTQKTVQRIKDHELSLGDFDGGVKIKLHEKQLTIDLSGDVVKEMVAQYVIEDFREKIFEK